LSYLDRLTDRFPDLPPGVLLKADLLRGGVRLAEPEFGHKYYSHHDEKGQKPQPTNARQRQGSVQLPDGSHVFIAQNPKSKFVLRMSSGGADAELGYAPDPDGPEETVCDVRPGPQFQWTSQRTTKGAPLATIFVPSLGGACGPIAVFLLRYCEFTVAEEECKFCSWVRMGKSTEMRPDVEGMREALALIQREQKSIGYLAFSGGSLFKRTKEADPFVDYMHAVRETGVALPPTIAAVQALDREDSIRLRDAGFDYVAYSMEVWHEDVWPIVIPGKTRSLGRAAWMDRLKAAVDVFGPGRVACNFVAGVETAAGVFRTPEDAAESTLEGMRWCYENGIYPRYTVWIVPGASQWGDRDPAPLEYYARLLPGRQALYADYSLPVPQTDCARCLTESCEADLARLDPARFAQGAAGKHPWQTLHAHA
jgi:hypothetical protein